MLVFNERPGEEIQQAADARFDGVSRLYGATSLQRLRAAHVAVIGLGGVGSWTVEALARSGVGEISLVDLDDICASNINRQVHALTDTIGQFKADAMASRVRAINPGCQTHALRAFLTEANVDSLLAREFDVVVDAFDSSRLKAMLASECRKRSLPLVMSGGSGGRRDPCKIRVDDLARTSNDSLLHRVRKLLRTKYDFPRDMKRRFGITTVYSLELPVFPASDGTVCDQPEPGQAPTRLGCAQGFGSAVHVTGAFGFAAAAEAIRLLTSTSKTVGQK